MDPEDDERQDRIARVFLWGSLGIAIAELVWGLWWVGLLRHGGLGSWPW